jgi:hypothetical protein
MKTCETSGAPYKDSIPSCVEMNEFGTISSNSEYVEFTDSNQQSCSSLAQGMVKLMLIFQIERIDESKGEGFGRCFRAIHTNPMLEYTKHKSYYIHNLYLVLAKIQFALRLEVSSLLIYPSI